MTTSKPEFAWPITDISQLAARLREKDKDPVTCAFSDMDPRSLQTVLDGLRNRIIYKLTIYHTNIKPILVELRDILKTDNFLTALHLHHSLEDEDVVYIAEALRNNVTIKDLNLANNKIGVSGAQAIADMILHNRGIETLDLFNNQINKVSAKNIVRSLICNTKMTELKMGNILRTHLNEQNYVDSIIKQTLEFNEEFKSHFQQEIVHVVGFTLKNIRIPVEVVKNQLVPFLKEIKYRKID